MKDRVICEEEDSEYSVSINVITQFLIQILFLFMLYEQKFYQLAQQHITSESYDGKLVTYVVNWFDVS
jgi:hypothetical protein